MRLPAGRIFTCVVNRIVIGAISIATLAAACNSQPPFVVLTVEDSERVATAAIVLAFGSDPTKLEERGILGRDFPITVTLTSDSKDPKTVWVEGRSSSNITVARGSAMVSFDDERPPTAVIHLGRACETTPDCEDNTFCNGPASCANRVCIPGEKPCPPSPFACVTISCIEQGRTCGVAVNHSMCAPIGDGNGNMDPSYCDPATGCVRGMPCSGGQECQDGSMCNGQEECVGSHCVAGAPPALDDGSPCTVDACVEPDGASHFPDMFHEGTECMAAGNVPGICTVGRCLSSACGDGVLDPRTEACDDGNDNPTDGCDQCRLSTWTPTLVTGYGIGGGDPLNIAINYVVGLAVDRRGTLYVADGGNGVVIAVDGDTHLATVVAGNGALPFSVETVSFGGPATEYGLGYLSAVGVDTSSNVYFYDDNYSRAFKVDATNGISNLFAGNGSWVTGPLGLALSTPISSVTDLFADGRGNVYMSSYFPAWVLRVDAMTSLVTLIAGSADDTGFSGDGGPATSALLDSPSGIAADADGNVYIADQYNNRIRKVDVFTGRISTIAGNGSAANSGDNGPGTLASLNIPQDLVLGKSDQLYIADWGNNAIRQLDLNSNTITTLMSGLADPGYLAIDRDDNLYIAETGHVSKRDAVTGAVTRVVGGGQANPERAVRSTSTPLYAVDRIAVNSTGILYFETQDTIARLDPSTLELTLVASADEDHSLEASNVSATTGDLYFATNGKIKKWNVATGTTSVGVYTGFVNGLAVDANGNVIFTQSETDSLVRKMNATTGAITTIAGSTPAFSGDGAPAINARLDDPGEVTIDARGNIFIVDRNNSRIRKIDVNNGNISTVAGNGVDVSNGDGNPATSAGLEFPQAVSFTPAGEMLIACEGRVRKVDTSGIITTIAGIDAAFEITGDGGLATEAGGTFYDIVAAPNGDLFIAADERVRKIDSTAIITTVAGLIEPNGDGQLPRTKLSAPTALTEVLDSTGHPMWLFADSASGRIRGIDLTTNTQSTVAGYPGGIIAENAPAHFANVFSDPRGIVYDRTAKKAYISEAGMGRISVLDVAAAEWKVSTLVDSGLNNPDGMAIDDEHRVLYVADSGQHVVARIPLDDPNHPISILAGQPHSRGYVGDGVNGTTALLSGPRAVAVGPRGNVYVADTGNRRVRRIDSGGRISDVLGDGSRGSSGTGAPAKIIPVDEPLGLTVDAYGNLYVSSKDTLRVVTAGYDGVATGDDEVMLIYGIPPREVFPEPLTSCLTGNAIVSDTRIFQLDRCRGFLIQLDRTAVPFGGG